MLCGFCHRVNELAKRRDTAGARDGDEGTSGEKWRWERPFCGDRDERRLARWQTHYCSRSCYNITPCARRRLAAGSLHSRRIEIIIFAQNTAQPRSWERAWRKIARFPVNGNFKCFISRVRDSAAYSWQRENRRGRKVKLSDSWVVKRNLSGFQQMLIGQERFFQIIIIIKPMPSCWFQFFFFIACKNSTTEPIIFLCTK